MAGLISASLARSSARLEARLTEKARILAEAEMKNRLLAARKDGTSWRKASLLWPLFTKGQ